MEFNYPKYHKSIMLHAWKRIGVIYHDFDDLYDVYIKTMNCWHCNKEFVSTRDRCLDHDHTTGSFRAIICHKCNCMDSYIKYPNGYDKKKWDLSYYIKNREKSLTEKKEKIKCICGSKIARGGISAHKQTDKHLKNMDKYMNNID